MLFTALALTLVLGALTGFLWGGLDAGIAHVTGNFVPETQLTSIIRMVVSGLIASNIASWLLAMVFGAVPVGLLASIISLVVAVLLWQQSRDYVSRLLR